LVKTCCDLLIKVTLFVPRTAPGYGFFARKKNRQTWDARGRLGCLIFSQVSRHPARAARALMGR
jgi:hypothetical protein